MLQTGLCFKQDQGACGAQSVSVCHNNSPPNDHHKHDNLNSSNDKHMEKKEKQLNGAGNKPFRLESTLKGLIFAFATFRLTSTSTSSTISAATATATSTSASSLSALFKTLLIGCYYMLAFSSILLIIIYINHVTTTSPQQNKISLYLTEGTRLKEAALRTVPKLNKFLEGANLYTDFDRSNEHFTQMRGRIKRSISEGREMFVPKRSKTGAFYTQQQPSGLTNKFQTTQATKSIENSSQSPRQISIRSKFVGSNNNLVQLKSQNKRHQAFNTTRKPHTRIDISGRASLQKARERQDTLAELTERHASGNLPANSNNSRQTTSGESQWIPIVEMAPRSRAPTQSNNRKPLLASDSTIDVIEATYVPLAGESSSDFAPNRPQYYPPLAGRHWRRKPNTMLNVNYREARQSKMYKRVLLCDKTLVSLDYIRNVGAEPRPYNPNNFENEIFGHENSIELDSKLEPSVVALDGTSSSLTSNQSSPETLAKLESRYTDHEEEPVAYNYEPRVHLTDEDPLVKCDMWDLEKGLKNRKPPADLLHIAIKADFDTVRDAINRCRQLSEKTLPPDDEFRDGIEVMSTEDLISLFSIKRGLIPGTKWCGLGDQATSYNDLGSKHRIDICCRAHDHCPIRLKPFRNDYGVLNIALYTKSHCDCDADFYRCLREVHSRTADMLGNLYFNVMKLQCMREERMKICREVKPIALGFERCIRYEDSPVRTVFRFTTPPVAY